MSYPDDFNVPTFTAGKSIAVSRMAGIGIMSGFLIIIFLCGILIWTMHSVRVEPYILTTGGINDQWNVVTAGNARPRLEMTRYQVVQQSLVWKFVQNWFSISTDVDANLALWDASCQRNECNVSDTATTSCTIYCTTSDDLFRRFKEDVLPTYQDLAEKKSFWSPIIDSIHITPVGRVTDAGGTWRIKMSVATPDGNMNIMAYAKVVKSKLFYPATLGYYISDFNAYRIY